MVGYSLDKQGEWGTLVKTTVILVDLTSEWTHREVVEVEKKWDADVAADQLARQHGLNTMRHHQTTILNKHFVTLWGTRKARRSALEEMWLLRNKPSIVTK